MKNNTQPKEELKKATSEDFGKLIDALLSSLNSEDQMSGEVDDRKVTLTISLTEAAYIALATGSLKTGRVAEGMIEALPFDVCEHVRYDSAETLASLGEICANAVMQSEHVEIDSEMQTFIDKVRLTGKIKAQVGSEKLPKDLAAFFARALTLAHED